MFFSRKKIKLTLEQKEMLMRNIEKKKKSSIQIALPELVEQLNIVPYWKNILSSNDVQYKVNQTIQIWENEIKHLMPKMTKFIKKYLVDVDLVFTKTTFSVLYYCLKDDTVFCFEGPMPIQKISNINSCESLKYIPNSLRNFYENIHNGFYIMSFGLLPIENIINLKTNYYAFFTNGQKDYIGYEFSNTTSKVFMIINDQLTSDDELDFWEIVDYVFSSQFQ